MLAFGVIADLELIPVVLRFLADAADRFAVFSEYFGVGELLEDALALFLAPGEEGGELPLGEHRHTAELLEAESYGFQNDFAGFGFVPVLGSAVDLPSR